MLPRRSTSSWRPGCLPPSRARAAAGFLLDTPRRPPVRAAHTFSPGWGEVPLVGHCEPRAAGARRPVRIEIGRASAFVDPRRSSLSGATRAPGADDPSTPARLGRRGRGQGRNALPVPHRPQRPDGFYDREPAARCAANFMSGLCPTSRSHTTKKSRLNRFIFSTRLSTDRRALGGVASTSSRKFGDEMASVAAREAFGLWITLMFECQVQRTKNMRRTTFERSV